MVSAPSRLMRIRRREARREKRMFVAAWLSYKFDSERSRPKLQKIKMLEATGGLKG